MTTLHTAALCQQARTLTGNTKKTVLIHAAIALGGSALMTALNYLFSLQIADTGGLSGLGLRSLLTTAQSLAELAVMIALPFWEMGLLYTALQWARGEQAGLPQLTQGFRRFGAVLGVKFLYVGIFLMLGMGLAYFSAAVFMLTPWAGSLMEIMKPTMDAAVTPEQLQSLLTPELLDQMTDAMIPLFILFGAVYALVGVPLFYRLRFSDYAVMDGMGAGKAVTHSLRITRRNCWQLVKLDLRFWWFYGLQLLCLGVSVGDKLLPLMGVSLPISADASFFLFALLGALCQLVLLWQCQGSVLTAYCLAFDAFSGKTPHAEPAQVTGGM